MIKTPDRLWFTVKQLAERWKQWGISTEMIEHYVQSYRLYYLSDCPPKDPAGIPNFEVLGDYSNYISLEEVERFEKENNMTSAPCTNETLTAASGRKTPDSDNPKAVGTLLKLVATMAVKGYSYDPQEKKSNVPAEIVTDAEALGISIDVKTVRDWLKKSSELIEQDKLE